MTYRTASHSFHILTTVMALSFGSALQAQDPTPAQTDIPPPARTLVPDFEIPGVWTSAPFEFEEGDWKQLDNFNRTMKRKGWDTSLVSRDDIAGGLTLSEEHVKSGKYSGRWADLPKFPSVAARLENSDWSGKQALRFSVYSERATNDMITLGLRSDNPATTALDYYLMDFPVDWTGWKEIVLPFSGFRQLGNPKGWDQIDGIYFFSKSGRRSPDPRTALFLDAMELLTSAPEGKPAQAASASTPSSDGIFFSVAYTFDAPVDLNHDSPELAVGVENKAPYIQTPFFQGVRSHLGYFPRFDAGFVSFDPDGKAYVRSPGVIESLDSNGKWVKWDLSDPIKEFARQQGWKGIALAWSADPTIRFDSEGGIYALENVQHLDASGKEVSAEDRTAVLLHSVDRGHTWSTYKLPGQLADFEKIDGHNPDAIRNPPVIILSAARYFAWADPGGYLLIPEKNPDGSLTLPDKIRFATDVLTGPVHSGSGNFAISQGDKVFVVYATYPDKGKEEAWLKDLPIPPEHPARQMSFQALADFKKVAATDGVPAFVTAYDRKSKTLSKPVFLGFGGRTHDGHNWPSITADSKGILHVVINGHIDPLVYTSSLRPGDISEWTPPVYITKKPDSSKYAYVSYASLNCDAHDNILCVVRSDTDDYNHRLAYLRKPAGGPWESEKDLVVPFSGGYHVWTHKIGYDPVRDRFFLGYYDQSNMIQMTRPDYLFYRFYWPETEGKLVSTVGVLGSSLNTGMPAKDKTGIFTAGPAEAVVLFSESGGQNWKIATTPDFEPAAKPSSR